MCGCLLLFVPTCIAVWVQDELKVLGGGQQVRRGIDPKEWATVDIDTIASSKLKRYLVARRAAAAVAV